MLVLDEDDLLMLMVLKGRGRKRKGRKKAGEKGKKRRKEGKREGKANGGERRQILYNRRGARVTCSTCNEGGIRVRKGEGAYILHLKKRREEREIFSHTRRLKRI